MTIKLRHGNKDRYDFENGGTVMIEVSDEEIIAALKEDKEFMRAIKEQKEKMNKHGNKDTI